MTHLRRLLKGSTALAGATIAALALPLSLPAAAQNWTGATSTDWTDGTNWDSGVVPTSPSSVTIDGGLPSVLGVGGAATGSAGALSIGVSGIGSLTIQNGSTFASNGVTLLGDLAGSIGVLNVTGTGSLFNKASGLLVLGNQGNGALHILNGGTVLAAGGVRLGTAGSSGGALSISNGGTLETTGLQAGASGAREGYFDNGTLRALGNSSAWISGFSGTELNIAAGGLTLDSNGFAVGGQSSFSGVGSLTKTGAGTVVLSAFQTYTGETMVQSGTLMLTNSASLAMSSGVVVDGTFDISGITAAGTDIVFLAGSGAVVLGTKTLTIANASSIFSGSITGSGALVISGGTQILTGTNTYTGGTMIAFGSALRIGDGGTSGSMMGNVANAGTLTFNRSNDISFSGNISSAGSLRKLGAGTLVLSGFNTYSGGTLVTAGVLEAGSADAIGSGMLTLNGGTFRAGTSFTNAFANPISLGGVGGTIDVNGQVMTLSSDISDVGGGGGLLFTNTASAIGAAELAGNNSYSVQTAVGDRVTLIAAADTAFSPNSDVAIANTGALLANGHNVTVRSLSGGGVVGNGHGTTAGSLTIALPSGTASYAGVIIDGEPGDAPLALIKTGAGTQTLWGPTSYTGGTTIAGGTLALSGAGSLAATGQVNLLGAGAHFNLSAATEGRTIGGLSGAAGSAITLGANTLTFGDATNQTFAGSISGTGGIVKQGAGRQTLSGTSNYGGTTTVAAGELRVDGALTGAGAMTVAAGATLSGTGGIAGAVTVDGTLSAGHSPGTLTVGTLTLNGGSTSIFELNSPGVVGGSDPVTGNDLVQVTGDLTLGGALDARVAAAGYYRLFDYGGTLSGGFASQSVTSTQGGFTIAGAQVETAVAGQVNLAVLGTGQTMQFWDGANTSSNGTVDGGAGTWAGFGTNWTSSTGSANGGWGNSVGIFAGAAGGAVSVAGAVAFDTLQFSTNGYALSGGTLSIAPASGSAGTFNVDSSVQASIASTIADGGGTAITKVGGGRLVLSGNNSYTGGTAINGGTLQVSADANLGAASGGLSLDGGTLATTASFAMFRPVTLAGAGGVDVAASTQFELGGSISGSGSLTKLGAGTLVLSGFNTHSGGTVVTAGILEAGSAAALGSGPLTLDRGTFRAGTSFTNNFANAIRVNAAGGMIDVNGQVMTLSGNISDGSGAGGALAFVNSGAFIGAAELAGVNTLSGRTSVGDGVTLVARSDTAFSPNSDVVLAATGALLANGRNVTVRSLSGTGAVGNGHDTLAGTLTIALPSGWASYAGVIMDGEPGDAPLALVKTGAGTQILTGTNTYSGGTTITGGVLQIGDGGTSGSITGDVVNNSTLSFNRADDVTFAGAISGTGDVQKHHGAGTLRLTGVNSYSGGTLVAGTLIGSATSFGSGGITNLGRLVIDQPSDAVFANAISGIGTFTKRGAGNLNLTGTSTLSGATTVEAGRLSVNGALANSAVTVLSGATLGGSGMIGTTTIGSGGVVAPGNSIGTLSVYGDLLLSPGSLYEVEIAGNGTSDRIAVSGTATVTGSQLGVTALDPRTSYISGQRYTVLTATGGVSGSASAISRSAFLDLAVEQQPNQLDLVIQVRNSGPGTPPGGDPVPGPTPPSVFETVAQTRNQYATAVALDTLPQAGGTLALYNSLLMLDAPGARQAFDALSGEIHASAKTALIDESWLLRGAMNDRLRSAFGGVGAAPMATLNYGFAADLAPSATGLMPALRSERFAVWGQGYGAWGRSEGDGNASKLTRSTGGFLVGADAAVFDNLRFGVIAGYSRSEFDVTDRLSSGESDNYHLGLYGGGQWGALGLRAGASYTWHDMATRRTVAFAGFSDGTRAGYDAGTAQVFGELGYSIALGRAALEPFAGLAYVNLHSDGFEETGGAAALSGRGDDTGVGYSTLGLRASTSLDLGGMALTLRGALAWRHAFGEVDPKTTLAFAGASAFTVAGIPIARDAALVEAGLDLAIRQNATLGLSYTGQLAQDAQDHAFKGAFAVRF